MTELQQGLVKWTVAVAVLAGVVVYSLDRIGPAIQSGLVVTSEDDETAADPTPTASDGVPAPAPPGGEPPPPVPTGPVEDGSSTPEADLAVADGTVTGRSGGALDLGGAADDAVLLTFPLIEGAPNCVADITLQLEVEEATTTTELAVRPSGVENLGALSDGESPVGSPVLDATSGPLALVTGGSPGRLQWDVTALYRTWASGIAFPSGATVPVGRPFTVAVTAAAGADANREITFSATEAGASTAPSLEWTGIPGCGA